MARIDQTEMAAVLAAIPHLPRTKLLEKWIEAFGSPPPKGLSTRLLIHAVAYQLQAKRLGGLPKSTLQKLMRVVEVCAGETKPSAPRIIPKRLSSGTRLMRDWHGKTYIVDVQEAGFRYDGRTYRSLSQIARLITGTHWSGPRFFSP